MSWADLATIEEAQHWEKISRFSRRCFRQRSKVHRRFQIKIPTRLRNIVAIKVFVIKNVGQIFDTGLYIEAAAETNPAADVVDRKASGFIFVGEWRNMILARRSAGFDLDPKEIGRIHVAQTGQRR